MSRFHVMVKPIGPTCNLNCSYCFYRHKQNLLSTKNNWRMSDEVLENFIKQYIEGQDHEEIVFSWQGGEPTLLGIDFFKKVVALERKYAGGKRIENDLQTNGVLLDDAWCTFLKEHNFLVGLSIDGPQGLHDTYRVDVGGKPSFEKVFAAAKRLKKYGVVFNALVTLNYENAKKPLEVYQFVRDEVQPRAIQINACVEPKSFKTDAPPYCKTIEYPKIGTPAAKPRTPDSVVYDWSVDPDDYGNFLCTVFDEWYQHDVGKVFVYTFECTLARYLGVYGTMCVFDPFCGKGLAIEHNGDVYSCDHFVYGKYRLGNIKDRTLHDMAFSPEQVNFGFIKKNALPKQCKTCAYLFACSGECPKNRFIRTTSGDVGLNYLCSGLKKYFEHVDPYLSTMVNEMKKGRTVKGESV